MHPWFVCSTWIRGNLASVAVDNGKMRLKHEVMPFFRVGWGSRVRSILLCLLHVIVKRSARPLSLTYHSQLLRKIYSTSKPAWSSPKVSDSTFLHLLVAHEPAMKLSWLRCGLQSVAVLPVPMTSLMLQHRTIPKVLETETEHYIWSSLIVIG